MEHGNEARGTRAMIKMEYGNEAREGGQHREWSMEIRLGEEGNAGSGKWE